ncbi:MFS transporter [Actinoplanes oblitus]|uniref:MFS transporter n=1 Tax=Actinoplanes oblitus TaxID=3040509 RepID=A0ABY8W9T1_9ACTN|nr:MFS transporter [Actinoplanes oblitus]WIM93149.1 MFS transporter [Actinoplanes oblitus]
MRRADALSFLLFTVFLDMLGLGLIVPIVPALLTELTADPGRAVLWSGLLGTTFGLLQFGASPLLGRLADRYGRRPVLLLSLACLGVDWLAHALAGSPWTLLLFHAVAGACAGTGTVVNAYLADVTPPEGRARAYGLVGAAFGLGFVAGPTIGGLLGAVDVRLPFFAAAALSFANLAYGRLILPESRPGDRTTPLTARTTNPLGAIAALLRRPVLGRLAGARLCADLARMIQQATWAFFLTYRFAWTTTHVGLVIAASALAGALFQARAVGPIVRRLGEKRTAVAGGLLSVTVFAGTAFASTPWQLYVLLVVGVPASAGGAAAQSWISATAGAGEQGTVQGALSAIGAVAETVVPLAAGAAFGALLAYGKPGLIFVVAAACAATATLLLATTSTERPPIGA